MDVRPLRGALAALLALLLLLCPLRLMAAFPDVVPGSWYADAVAQMETRHIITGYPDGTFRPMEPISAAEFVTIAARCAALAPVPTDSSFWAAGQLQAALQAGWYDWDELPPTGERYTLPIRRDLAVKILMRGLFPNARGGYNTESAKIADFDQLNGRYYETTFAAYAAGIIVGDGAGRFLPGSPLTRAEACVIFQRALALLEGDGASLPPGPSSEPSPPAVTPRQGGVSENGWLQVTGTQLCNEAGEPIVLRGMSTHGLQWYSQYTNSQSIANTASFGANVFRVAMYTAEGGYLSDPDGIWDRAIAAVDAAIAQDLYVILDWHILFDGDPMTSISQAEAFFTRLAQRYADTPNLIYEICNEPNGSISWEGNVRPYAQRVIAAIRAQSPRGVILIGSTTWSQDIHLAAQSPLEGDNLMYSFHFYAGTHGQGLRDRLDACLKAGLPVFVTEWGTSRADGSGGVFLEESARWLDFLADRGVSWCNWSLCDKDETSAALKPGTPATRPWTTDDLSPSGRFVFSRFGG